MGGPRCCRHHAPARSFRPGEPAPESVFLRDGGRQEAPNHCSGAQTWCAGFRQGPRGSEYRENFPIIELKDEREEYIVTASLVPELAGEFVTKTLYTAITRQNTVFFWPVRLPSPDGKDMNWWRSGRDAAALAMNDWVRVKANMGLGAYDIFKAERSAEMPQPEWPELGFWDLIKIAFRDHLITTIDHPVIQRLRGQV